MGMLKGEVRQSRLLAGLAWLLLCAGSLAQAADACRAVFSSGLQTHGSGGVVFQWGAQLLGNTNPVIDTRSVRNPWGTPTCGTQNCQASGFAASSLNLALPNIVAQHDLRVNYLGNGEAGGEALNRYRSITLDAGATLSFNPRHQAYYIQRLSLAYGAKVTLAPGRYWIGQLDMAANSQLRVAGGTAKVMLGSSLNLPFHARVNGVDDGSGTPEFLQLFVLGDLNLESSAAVNALAYVEGDYRAAFAARFNGALNARSAELGTAARIENRPAAIATLPWNSQCQERGDLDSDGLIDLFDDDTDGDGYDDERERVAGSDMRDAQSTPGVPPPATQPNLCVAAFAKGLQTHASDGRIGFGFNAQLRDGPTAYLPAMRVDNSFASVVRSCGSSDCQASFTPARVPAMPAFLKTTDGFRQDVPFAGSVTLDGSRKEWARLTVGGLASARFTTAGSYRLRELEVGYRGTLELAPGDYWIEKLIVGTEARILPLAGSGTVRLHVLNNLDLPWQARLNATGYEQPGDPSRLLVLAENGVTLASSTTVAGFIYARGNLTQQYGALLYGGAVAANLSLDTLARTHFNAAALTKVDFGLLCDLDGDGIGDNQDEDRDGDGISNEYEEQVGTNPDDPASVPPDADRDGIPDSLDDDRDGDGVPNAQDAFPDDPSESKDTDGDGIGDNRDEDRDGDGISNAYEEQLGTDPDDPASKPADLDQDGIPDALDDDRDGDGVPNAEDELPDDPTDSKDLDKDGIGDKTDPDIDGDNVPNDQDAFPRDPTESRDTDGDGVGDNSDPDIDGDGVPNGIDAFPFDPLESKDTDGDGIGDNADSDRDGDGYSNDLEQQVGTDPDDASSKPADLDQDGIPDVLDDDRDGDGVANDEDELPDDPTDSKDLDKDGIGDSSDPDIDGDGVSNEEDAFPRDPAESKDLDGDGIGDNADTDRDGDGYSNDDESQFGSDPDDATSKPADLDGDGIPDGRDEDIDGDGVANEQDAFPRDPTETSDLDGDGIGDNADPDVDGDGVANADDAFPRDPAESKDTDGDGQGDNSDPDIDGDGVINDQDAFPFDPTETKDTDGDGIGDNTDDDRDGDGISNAYEEQLGTNPDDPASKPADLDGDGVPDALDDDRDGDGVPNDEDELPDDPTDSKDLDKDGIGDKTDPDIDGDGVANEDDAFPRDATESRDTDGDGIGDNADPDIDGDGVPNGNDAFPLDPTESKDTDGDGIGDNADPDRDGDGFSNEEEIQLGSDPDDATSKPADLDGDGIPDARDDDIDGDGVANAEDAFPRDPSESADLDRDGIGDNSDPDIDGDGVANGDDAFPRDPAESKDTDGDGIGDNADPDIDGDGVPNGDDAFPLDPAESKDTDGDGIGDNADPDRDGDGYSNEEEIQLGSDPDDAASKPADLDGDGIPDARDDDIDGDGVANADDAFPRDPTESHDLDKDGIGDNSDPDIDGDGFSNAEETAAGSDPRDAASVPDREGPELVIDGPDVINVNEDSVSLRGSVSDAGKGVDRLVLVSDRFPGTPFAVTLQGSQWTASVPLLEGTNLLTLTAYDKAGNSTQRTRTVERQPAASDIGLVITFPAQSATVKEAALVVRGTLRSDRPAQRLEVLVNGQAATLAPTAQVTEFIFQSATLTLQPGPNTLTIQGWVDQRSVQRSVLVTYQPPQTSFAPPRFDNLSPQDGAQLSGSGFVFSGQIVAEAGLERVSLNGRNLALRQSGMQVLDLREPLTVPAGQPGFEAELVARDLAGQETRRRLSWTLDQQPPQIILDQPLVELPAQNRVSEHPYPVRGTLRESNPASFQVNGQDVTLEPGAQAGEFRFATQLSLPIGKPASLVLEARDQAGNQLRREYSLELFAQAAIAWVLPTEGTELLDLGQPISLQVAARIEDLTGQLVPRALLLSASGDTLADAILTGDTTLKSAMLQVPAQSGQYRLLAVLQDGSQQVVAQSSRTISVVTPQQVPVALERIAPANGESGADPNEFISLYFNQAIDISKLDLKVFETANGKTYVDLDALGTSELEAKGYQLVDVNRNYQAVPGKLAELPGSQVVAFYPERDIAYNAEVSVEVRYDGQELERIRYRTRPLPTFIAGVLLDQLQQPIPNVEVRIEGLERSTRTNRDGAFNFGYGDSAERNIPGGRYTLLLNPGQGNRGYGSDSREISIQQGVRNELGHLQLAQLNLSLPYVPLRGGRTFSLVDGEYKLDLSNASLQFPDGRQGGDVHVQMLQFSELPYPVEPLAMPYWMYAIQPAGITVQGAFSIDLAALKLGDSYEYLPENGGYVAIVGFDREARRVVPVGAGVIDNLRIRSQGPLAVDNLDLIGFALADAQLQDALKAYADGSLNLRQLQAEFYRVNQSR
ncbi:thrombospondin type 3 repeat-containing protein [Pseudomonas indica]|uniref:thrombospondin type 3 repeat-containing protein n=1 Tax=Pseudomonas indica TaxID=137658 RepID=UPI003FD1C8F4